MKNNLDDLIIYGEEICDIYSENLRRKSSQGFFDATGRAPSVAHEWLSDVKIFSKREVKDHPLFDSLESVLFHEKNNINDVRKILVILKSLNKDEYFIKEDLVLQKKYSLEKMLGMDIAKCEKLLEGTDDIHEFKRVYQLITARYDGIISDFGNGLYSYFSDGHFYDSEIGIESLRYNIKLLVERMRVYRMTAFDNNVQSSNENKPIIFISHKSNDSEYGEVIRNLLIQIGLKNSDIVFTSNPSNKIPFGIDIFEYLKQKIHSETFVLYLLSDAYFSSSACLNEMGAAWVIQADSNSLYTPDFNHDNPGYLGSCAEKSKMGATLNGDRHCRNNLIELVKKIKDIFNLELSHEDITNFADEACEKFIKIKKGD